jgi:hypothetical protein
MNVYLKNKKHVLKLLIMVGVARLNNCPIKHWEGMKHLVALEAKQGEVARNCAMRVLVTTLSHNGNGGEVGVARRLVSSYFFHCFQQFSNVQLSFWIIFHLF